MKWMDKVLWIDGLAALFVGSILISFHSFVGEIYSMPEKVVLFLASANLLYGLYSSSLAMSRKVSLRKIQVLVFGNCFWALTCLFLVYRFMDSASLLGILFILSEALFVTVLAGVEWRCRFDLSATRSTA
ncbi:hypothetical protein [Photobacterium atrarenae]|uniref:Uncharacterized protein n=1 Tax=Photobacterium atrarenae TaxID=865757 RepID=A0ABY5GN37_9GAMM|nr:hypothetical protein [Photobacterium atrarenae]UTV30739.1 hypothetical protein NNL38_19455 [Photobacterium atrarenae]